MRKKASLRRHDSRHLDQWVVAGCKADVGSEWGLPWAALCRML